MSGDGPISSSVAELPLFIPFSKLWPLIYAGYRLVARHKACLRDKCLNFSLNSHVPKGIVCMVCFMAVNCMMWYRVWRQMWTGILTMPLNSCVTFRS